MFHTRPNIGLQATPLARPHTWRVFHAYHVPPAVAFKEVASGALEAQRWAALNPRRPCRTGNRIACEQRTNLLSYSE